MVSVPYVANEANVFATSPGAYEELGELPEMEKRA